MRDRKNKVLQSFPTGDTPVQKATSAQLTHSMKKVTLWWISASRGRRVRNKKSPMMHTDIRSWYRVLKHSNLYRRHQFKFFRLVIPMQSRVTFCRNTTTKF